MQLEKHEIKALVIDLDGTVYYGKECEQIDENYRIAAIDFCSKKLGLEPTAARATIDRLFEQYGSSVHGLHVEHGIDPREYQETIQDAIDYSIIKHNPALVKALEQVHIPIYIFTSNLLRIARKVLSQVGISGHIYGIFDINMAGYKPKSMAETYEKMLQHFGIAGARDIMMCDDVYANLRPAHQLGAKTGWVSSGAIRTLPEPHFPLDYQKTNLVELLNSAIGDGTLKRKYAEQPREGKLVGVI